jgi:hypothetical protein
MGRYNAPADSKLIKFAMEVFWPLDLNRMKVTMMEAFWQDRKMLNFITSAMICVFHIFLSFIQGNFKAQLALLISNV